MIRLKTILYEANLPIDFDRSEISQIDKSLRLSNTGSDDMYIVSGNRYLEFTKHKDGFAILVRDIERENEKIVKDKVVKIQNKIKTIKDLIKIGKKFKQRYL